MEAYRVAFLCLCFPFQEGEITSADVNEDGTVLAVNSNDMYVLHQHELIMYSSSSLESVVVAQSVFCNEKRRT